MSTRYTAPLPRILGEQIRKIHRAYRHRRTLEELALQPDYLLDDVGLRDEVRRINYSDARH